MTRCARLAGIFVMTMLVMGGFAVFGPAAVAGWSCPAEAPEINLQRVLGKTKLYRTKDIHALTNMKSEGGAIRQGMHVNGLGGGKIGLEGQASFTVMQRGEQACIWLKGINAKFFAYPTIHVANNFPKESCEYNAVLEHEKKHILVLQEFHREFAPKFKTALRRIASGIEAQGPISASTIERVQKDMNERINRQIQSFNDSIIPVLEQRQNDVDNPQEYASVEAQCRNWHNYARP